MKGIPTTDSLARYIEILVAEHAEPTPHLELIEDFTARVRKQLDKGAEPTAEHYIALRRSYDNQSLDPADAEELQDLCLVVAQKLFESTLRKLEAESTRQNRDEGALEDGYDLLIDLTCDCGKDEDPNEYYENPGTRWFVAPTAEQNERFRNLKAPQSEQAQEDRGEMLLRFARYLREGTVSTKFGN